MVAAGDTEAAARAAIGVPSIGDLAGKQALMTTIAAITTNSPPAAGVITPYNASSGALLVALPALSGLAAGTVLGVQKAPTDSSANTVTLAASIGDTFDAGSSNLTLRLTSELHILQVVTIDDIKVWKVVGGSIPLSSLDSRYDGKGEIVVNVKDFGAVGDGTNDDSAAFTAALTAAEDGATVWVPDGNYYLATPVAHTRTRVNLGGSGTVKGKLIVGAFGAVRDFQGRSITGLKFIQSSASTDPTMACIELRNVMNLTITGCSFRDAGAAIYSYTEYDTARNTICNNFYHNVGYFFRSVTGPTPAGRDSTAQWRSLADIHIEGNNGQSNVTAVDCDSVDGIVITGNTFFSPGAHHASTVKEHNIKLGVSNQIVISDNNLFEAGLSAIDLTDPRAFTIADNNITYPGQRTPSDGISITFAAATFAIGSIGGGTIAQATKNVIGFYGTGAIELRLITITPFAIERSLGSTPATYYGADVLPTPYRIFIDPNITTPYLPAIPFGANHGFGINMPDNHRGRIIGQERYLAGNVKEQTLNPRVITITTSNRLYVLRNIDPTFNGYFGGTITLFMSNSGSTAKTACYHLLVCKTPESNTSYQCVTLGATGNTTGGAANDPSFTFDIEYASGWHYLRATKVGSTSGAFNYVGWATGVLHLA
ncbi:hypothetical protein Mspyr1_37780 [Mycolicibacterium gilvum Spyr1]|uniref:Rhamnogalacturonase A/B/Epimerase-like pectate lyase domain-containing protein n=1 Tax=Mycolicibacterium gilvum (strain DSM 45189 / LMG 24558 / Spyr1) TaxID=278137 RepID=E6TKG3_MYCSR|nr:hypothetical protein Mspyr1_37780 [Mycolicibacterium gilvum Spyr1]